MRRPRVLMDVDGVLTTGFVDLVCRGLRDWDYDARPEEVKEWDIFKSFNVLKTDADATMMRIRYEHAASLFSARSGTAEFLKRLREWADVVAVTSPLEGSPTWPYDRERWLNVYGFAESEIVSVRDKSLIRGDALIEDRTSNLIAWQEANPTGLSLLWTMPYNAADPWPGKRVSSFDELTAALEVLK